MNVYPALLSLFSPYYQDRLNSLFSLHFYYNIYKKKTLFQTSWNWITARKFKSLEASYSFECLIADVGK